MDAQYLFDSDGKWIAFRRGGYLFTPMGTWIGWFPWGDDYAVDTRGDYLGTVYLDERLYRFRDAEYRGYPGKPEDPGYQGYPGGYSGPIGKGCPPAMAYDIDRRLVLV